MGNYRFDERLAMDIAEKLLWAALILVVTWALALAIWRLGRIEERWAPQQH